MAEKTCKERERVAARKIMVYATQDATERSIEYQYISASISADDNQHKTNMVQSTEEDNPLDYLLLDSSDSKDEPEVRQIQLVDQGSNPQCARLVVGGVPMEGVVDSGSDITILGGEMFKQVSTVARLHKKDFKSPDKQPRTYNQQTYHIDGKVEVDISFDDRTKKTAVYVKMDAPKQLLLSEDVCRLRHIDLSSRCATR